MDVLAQATEAPVSRSAPAASVRMRRATAHKAKRREKQRRVLYTERLKKLARSQGERVQAKAAAREACIDQVTLDHERGLELGRIARAKYRDRHRAFAEAAAAAPARPQRRRKTEPRAADTYRWARKKMARGTRMGLVLRGKRMALGHTRSEMDRQRRQGGHAP